MPDVIAEAIRLGYPTVTDAGTDIDVAAARLLPADADAVGVRLTSEGLHVVTDHVPAAAEILALEKVAGQPVIVAVAPSHVLAALRARVSRPDTVPAVLDALRDQPHLRRATLRAGAAPAIDAGAGIATLPGIAPLSSEDLENLRAWLLPETSSAVVPWAGRRWRVTAGTTAGAPTITLQVLADALTPSLTDLGLPTALTHVADLTSGLVLVASPPRHGRSATLAALADRICATRSVWVTRVVDAAELDTPDRRSSVLTQVIGQDVPSVAAAVAGALRDSTSLLLIDTAHLTEDDVDAATRAALAGLLVLATVPAASVADAVTAWLTPVTAARRPGLAAALGQGYAAGLAQRLLPARDGGALVPAVEVWWRTPTLTATLHAADLLTLPSASHDTSDQGRRSIDMAQAIEALAAGGRIAGGA